MRSGTKMDISDAIKLTKAKMLEAEVDKNDRDRDYYKTCLSVLEEKERRDSYDFFSGNR